MQRTQLAEDGVQGGMVAAALVQQQRLVHRHRQLFPLLRTEQVAMRTGLWLRIGNQ